AGGVAGGAAAAGRVFPLRLGREPDAAAGPAGEPGVEGQGVVVGDEHHRVRVRLREARVPPVELLALHEALAVEAEASGAALLGLRAVAGLLHEARELAAGHFVLADVEIAAEADLALRLVVAAALLRFR